MRIIRIADTTLRPMSEFPRGADPHDVEVYEPVYSQRDGSRSGVGLSIKKWSSTTRRLSAGDGRMAKSQSSNFPDLQNHSKPGRKYH